MCIRDRPTTILLKKEDNQYKVIIEAMNKDCPDEVIYYKTDENVASNLDENDLDVYKRQVITFTNDCMLW